MIRFLAALALVACFSEPQVSDLSLSVGKGRTACPVVIERLTVDVGRAQFVAELAADVCTGEVWVCTEGGSWDWSCQRIEVDGPEIGEFFSALCFGGGWP